MDGLKLARAHLYLLIQCAPRCEVGEKRGHALEKDDVLSSSFLNYEKVVRLRDVKLFINLALIYFSTWPYPLQYCQNKN